MLAIVIPFYKITFFEATLQSLLHQTDNRFKVYIGDDASPESPTALLEKFKGILNFKYKKFENNLGGSALTKQWERCITMTEEEEWILVLGDDDVLGPNVVASFYSNLEEVEKNGINVVRYSSQKISKEGTKIEEHYQHPELENAEDFLIRKYEGKTRSSLSEYVFRKESYSAVGFRNFPLAWYSDVFAVLEISNFKNIFTINEAVVFVRYSDVNISSVNDVGTIKRKTEAKRGFAYSLLGNIEKFTKKKEILQIVVNYYRNDKKDLTLFLSLSAFYLGRFKIKEYFNFLKYVFAKVNIIGKQIAK